MPNDVFQTVAKPSPDTPAARTAWQPLTPGGVAAFATASAARLFLVELLVALLASVSVTWCLSSAWFPTVREAIRQLPDRGAIRDGELSSARASAEPLAEGRFLAIVVDLENKATATLRADIRVEFHRKNFQICSLLGCWRIDYPKEWRIAFNRPERGPSWDAWEPMLLGLAAFGIFFALLMVWSLLATIYFLIPWLIAFFKDRELTLRGSWRLASASLMPGALLLITAIFLYGLGAIDLIHLLVLAALHLVIGWVYLAVCPLLLPHCQAPVSGLANPFAPPGPGAAAD